MKLFPAIDLLEGRVVRLERGDYSKVKVYSDNPVEVACQFAGAGAEFLHVVDLDGARDGIPSNAPIIKNIIEASSLMVEVGGGIRGWEAAEAYLDAGAFRIILGTAAVADPDLVGDMCGSLGSKVAVGADFKDGRVAIKGWKELSGEDVFDFCRRMESTGVKTLICTDISKDGVLSGINSELYKRLNRDFSMDIVASGGVSTLDDIRTLKDTGIYGAILGRALYTGDISLSEACALCAE